MPRCGNCRGKRNFDSQKAANLEILGMWQRKGQSKYPHRSYFCETCYAWHITSMQEKPSWVAGG
jgi:hypothetical protein